MRLLQKQEYKYKCQTCSENSHDSWIYYLIFGPETIYQNIKINFEWSQPRRGGKTCSNCTPWTNTYYMQTLRNKFIGKCLLVIKKNVSDFYVINLLIIASSWLATDFFLSRFRFDKPAGTKSYSDLVTINIYVQP